MDLENRLHSALFEDLSPLDELLNIFPAGEKTIKLLVQRIHAEDTGGKEMTIVDTVHAPPKHIKRVLAVCRRLPENPVAAEIVRFLNSIQHPQAAL